MLGIEQDASREAILQAFRRLSKEKHPDKNLEDTERATRNYQKLNHAKMVLLDAEERRKHDEELIDSDVRNENALPLLCNICMAQRENSKSVAQFSRSCLMGFGHKSPLTEEFYASHQEYHVQRLSQRSKSQRTTEFIESLDQVLEEFLNIEWLLLYPQKRALSRERREQSNDDLPLPSFVTDILKQCYPHIINEVGKQLHQPPCQQLKMQ